MSDETDTRTIRVADVPTEAGPDLAEDPLMQDVEALFDEAVVIDGVCNIGRTPDLRNVIKESGINMIAHTMRPESIPGFDRFIGRESSALTHVRSAADIRRAKATGKLGITYYYQQGTYVEDDLGSLDACKAKGVMVVQLAYDTNKLGGGCRDDDVGLSEMGRQVVRRMNELGLVVDLSHCGKRTTLEGIELSTQPVTCNHANPKTVNHHLRNKTDEEIKALAGAGGVLGCLPLKRFTRLRGSRAPGIDDFVAHIDYVVDLVGVDHVGVAFDGYMRGEAAFPHVDGMGPYLNCHKRWKYVALMLLKRGYQREDIQKIVGGNFLRVYEQVLQ